MNQTITRRPVRPATVADFHRLAGLAEARGVDVVQDHRGRWMAISASTPGLVYALSGFSCSCAGFQSHQRCSHPALLLRRLGWLPELGPELGPELPSVAPVPAAIVATERCISCTVGKIEEWGVSGPIGCRPCDICGGSGRVPVLPEAQPARVAA